MKEYHKKYYFKRVSKDTKLQIIRPTLPIMVI